MQISQFSDVKNMLKLTSKVLENIYLTKSSLTLLKGYSLHLIVRLNTVCIILKSYDVFVDTVKELLFIVDCATKSSLYNTLNLFANLFIILFTGIVTWASFYYIELVRINSLLIHLQTICKLKMICFFTPLS